MEISWGRALWRNFLGQSPDWYKLALIIFLIVNPLIFLISPFVAGWLLVAEFIFTLAMVPEMLPAAPRWSVGYRSGIHRHDQRGTRP